MSVVLGRQKQKRKLAFSSEGQLPIFEIEKSRNILSSNISAGNFKAVLPKLISEREREIFPLTPPSNTYFTIIIALLLLTATPLRVCQHFHYEVLFSEPKNLAVNTCSGKDCGIQGFFFSVWEQSCTIKGRARFFSPPHLERRVRHVCGVN